MDKYEYRIRAEEINALIEKKQFVEAVKIADLAYNMIKLSGFIPNEDIQIEYTGLRPGEKLYEELLMSEEGLQSTENKLIHIGKPIDFDEELFLKNLKELKSLAEQDTDKIREKVNQSVC